MPMISSPGERFIPMTPMDARPVARTSVSWKRIHIPCLVTRNISLLLSVIFTSISSSSSLRLIAVSPFFLTLENSIRGVFFTIPVLVTINRFLSSLYSRIGIIAVIFSPGASGKRGTIAVPLAVRPASGISYAFNLYTLPILVKKFR